jgi:6-pyruvoyltetrahydropterin/6-carboxytetrahydropterin synthase
MYELVVSGDFAAAHNLRGYKGKCENLHGHNWKVEATLASDRLGPLGMVMDFKDVKQALASVLERYDHRYLNEVDDFKEINPTTENMGRIICERLAGKLPEHVSVRSVAVWESEHCCARYVRPEADDR